jgi:hypothetical protein
MPAAARVRLPLLALSFVALAGWLGDGSLAHAADLAPHSAPTNPLTYDARLVGLAGAGVAVADGGAASLHNPAQLQGIEQVAGTLSFTPYLVQLSAPFRFGRSTIVQKKTGLLFGPFAQMGLVVRLHERVVVGMNGFLTGAAGGTFANVPLNAFSDEAPRGVSGNVDAGQFAGEIQVPVAVRAARWLDLGVAYRLTQAYTFASTTSLRGAPLADVSLRGTHLRGVQVGATSHVNDALTLAASYRSEVRLDLNGSRRDYAPQDRRSAYRMPDGYRTPHQVRAGASYRPRALPSVLAVVEGHAEFYRRMDKRERDTFGGQLAGELTPLPWLDLRAGFGAATQPLTDRNAVQTAPPPSMGYSVSSGAGVRLARWRLDLALAYVTSGKFVRRNATPGRYAAEGLVGSASATYVL